MTSDHSPRQGSGNNNNNNSGGGRNHRNNNNRRRHHRNFKRNGTGNSNNNRPVNNNQPLDFQKTLHKYENLLDQHLQARRKYFEQYHRVAPEGRLRLENIFFKSIEQLRDFENKLAPDLKEQLQDHIDRYNDDSTYTDNHGLPIAPPPEEVPASGDDPHLLESQKRANFKADVEESVGSLDDYYSYKGVARPIPDESKEKH
jgi:hypothetical protein